MSEQKQKKRRLGLKRTAKPEAEHLVLVAGKIPPEMLAAIQDIVADRDWTISTAVRVGCRLLIQHEASRKNVAVNESLLTS